MKKILTLQEKKYLSRITGFKNPDFGLTLNSVLFNKILDKASRKARDEVQNLYPYKTVTGGVVATAPQKEGEGFIFQLDCEVWENDSSFTETGFIKIM